MSVIREVVLMHVVYLIVDPTPSVNKVFILLNAFVYLVIQGIHKLLVTNVSFFKKYYYWCA